MKYNVSTLNFGNYLGVFKERDIQNIRQEINKTTQKCDQNKQCFLYKYIS